MRELIGRFSYRYQLWRKEQESERWGADPSSHNPLRYIAAAAVFGLIVVAAGPFLFRRAPHVLEIAFIPVGLAFLICYRSDSKWAWYVSVGWVLFAFFAHWILRLAGYLPYQPPIHSLAPNWIFVVLDFAFLVGCLVWLVRVRDRYFRYIQGASSKRT